MEIKLLLFINSDIIRPLISMNEIKPYKTQTKYFGIFFIIVIIYICLVSADWCVKKFI